MSTAQTRVAEARRRLRERSQNPFVDDPAIRLVQLDSPRADEAPLELHRSLVILNSLDEAPRRALAATIDGIRQRNANVGLSGRVEIRGEARRLDSIPAALKRPGQALESAAPFVPSAEAALYAEVAASIDRSMALSSAELRGADAASAALSDQLSAATASLVADTPAEVEPSDRSAMLAMIDQIVLPPEQLAQVEAALAALDEDPERVSLQAAIEQAHAAKAGLLPGDGNQSIMLADLAIAEADGSLAAYDMALGGSADQLHELLVQLGLGTSPAEAPRIARRAVQESQQLLEMRQDLERRASGELGNEEPSEETDSIYAELRSVDELRQQIQRRLRSQQQLRAIAQLTLNELVGGVAATQEHDDLTPILIEDPLVDLPHRLSGAVLSMLLRYSVHRQVICVSDIAALQRWSESVGARAGWVQSHGWFLGRG